LIYSHTKEKIAVVGVSVQAVGVGSASGLFRGVGGHGVPPRYAFA